MAIIIIRSSQPIGIRPITLTGFAISFFLVLDMTSAITEKHNAASCHPKNDVTRFRPFVKPIPLLSIVPNIINERENAASHKMKNIKTVFEDFFLITRTGLLEHHFFIQLPLSIVP